MHSVKWTKHSKVWAAGRGCEKDGVLNGSSLSGTLCSKLPLDLLNPVGGCGDQLISSENVTFHPLQDTGLTSAQASAGGCKHCLVKGPVNLKGCSSSRAHVCACAHACIHILHSVGGVLLRRQPVAKLKRVFKKRFRPCLPLLSSHLCVCRVGCLWLQRIQSN